MVLPKISYKINPQLWSLLLHIWALEHAHFYMHLYPYLYEIKLLVNEIDQFTDDFHVL
jgi:hypothetical protein